MKKHIICLLLILIMFFSIIAQANILIIKNLSRDQYENTAENILDIEYSTYLGGKNFEWPMAIAVDGRGCAYSTGITHSFMFPIKNAFDKSYNLMGDAYITKISPSGKSIEYSTFIGGNNVDYGIMIDIDENGFIYLCGGTDSKNFPLKNSYQIKNMGNSDIFIVKLSPAGDEVIYSTLIGGSDSDLPRDFDRDVDGCVYVTGRTTSKDFPMKNSFDDTLNGTWDAFLFKMSPEGNALNFSTFIGGNDDDWGYGVEVDKSKSIYLSGNTSSSDFPIKNAYDPLMEVEEAYILKMNPTGNSINFSTFLGGSGGEKGWGLTIDEEGSVYICGRTESTDFPVINPIQNTKNQGWDMYVSKLSQNGSSLSYSTFLGGNGDMEDANRITVDKEGCSYITGFTTSSDFPVINPLDGKYGGKWDAFVSKISPDGGKLLYSSYLGGRQDDAGYQVVVDENGGFYITGWTESRNFPTLNAYDKRYNGLRDGFVTKILPKEYYPIQKIKGGLFLKVGLNSNESLLNWSINISGKKVRDGYINGTIAQYTYEKIKLKSTFGFGKVDITITANEFKKYYSAFMFGPLIFCIN